MIGTATLTIIRDSLLASAKEGKVALLFHFSDERDPARRHLIEKIQGLERTAQGIDLVLAGGTSELVQEGIDMIISSIDHSIPHAPSELHKMFYAERAHFLEMKEKFKKLDEMLEVECKHVREDVLLN